MNRKIIDRLREEFLFVGDEKISGKTVIKIIDDVVAELTIPSDVEYAMNYTRDCAKDMGFMGSPEYYRQKKIVDDYLERLDENEGIKKEWKMYQELRKKYDGTDIEDTGESQGIWLKYKE